ncbi:MAG: transporter substrate-binding domain-containing protein [Bauldia sp.]
MSGIALVARLARLGFGLALALTFIAAISAGPAPAQETQRPVRVATRVVPPFVMKEGDQLTGFSIDLWNAIAEQAGLRFTYAEKGPLAELLASVTNNEADLAVAAISITAARAKSYDFSQPIFAGGIQIMVPASGSGLESLFPSFAAFFSSRVFFQLLAALLILIIIPTPIIWLLERRHKHSELRSHTKIGEAFKALFWSATTVVGQTAGHPKTVPGRLMALVLILTGLTFISYFTASVTSALTVQRLQAEVNGLGDLAGKRTGTVEGSTSADFLLTNRIRPITFANINEAIEAMNSGRLDAVVYDAPVLLYYTAHDGNGKAKLAGDVLRPEDYGIMLPLGSPLRKTVDEALLRLRETGTYLRIYRRWFAADAG